MRSRISNDAAFSEAPMATTAWPSKTSAVGESNRDQSSQIFSSTAFAACSSEVLWRLAKSLSRATSRVSWAVNFSVGTELSCARPGAAKITTPAATTSMRECLMARSIAQITTPTSEVWSTSFSLPLARHYNLKVVLETLPWPGVLFRHCDVRMSHNGWPINEPGEKSCHANFE